METKRSWWKLTIDDYPNYKPNDVDLEHIAELIKQGYDQGELIQETEELMRLTLINILNAKGVIYTYYKQQEKELNENIRHNNRV